MARKQAWEGKKQMERDGRVSELKEKEQARMKGFMESLGIQPGQKISIPDRE